MKRTENKVVIVTGGALGIERETCILLAQEGAKVAITNILVKEGKHWQKKSTIPVGWQNSDILMCKMKKSSGGSIVNLSSIYGLVGAGDIPTYHASKGAVRLMSKNGALIYAKDNVRVDSVHSGFNLFFK
jgi:NAD(P)-dependent dehydrogenase (short-subunit alcohol dehydrogenase family)